MTEFHHRLHSKLNNKNVGQYVKAFLRYVSICDSPEDSQRKSHVILLADNFPAERTCP